MQPLRPKSINVIEVRSPEDMKPWLDEWEELIAAAAERNVFYEPAMLLAAWRNLAEGQHVTCLLFLGPTPNYNKSKQTVLCGLIPIKRSRFGLASLWRHGIAFLTTPLIRSNFVEDTLSAFFQWLRDNSKIAVLRMIEFPGEGEISRVCWHNIWLHQFGSWTQRQHYRAQLVPLETAQSFRHKAWTATRRKQIKRRWRQMREAFHNDVRVISLERAEDIEAWFEDFVALEASGWKGRQGGALSNHPERCAMLREALPQLFARKQLLMTRLNVAGRTIAMDMDLASGSTGFAFKGAYNERYAAYSPGTLLLDRMLDWFHEQDAIERFDSCAAENHPTLDRLWNELRRVETTWITASQPVIGRILLSILCLAYQLKLLFKFIRSRRATTTPGSKYD